MRSPVNRRAAFGLALIAVLATAGCAPAAPATIPATASFPPVADALPLGCAEPVEGEFPSPLAYAPAAQYAELSRRGEDLVLTAHLAGRQPEEEFLAVLDITRYGPEGGANLLLGADVRIDAEGRWSVAATSGLEEAPEAGESSVRPTADGYELVIAGAGAAFDRLDPSAGPGIVEVDALIGAPVACGSGYPGRPQDGPAFVAEALLRCVDRRGGGETALPPESTLGYFAIGDDGAATVIRGQEFPEIEEAKPGGASSSHPPLALGEAAEIPRLTPDMERGDGFSTRIGLEGGGVECSSGYLPAPDW